MRLIGVAVAALLGVVVGAGGMLGLQQAPARVAPAPPVTFEPVKAAPVPAPADRALLVWTPGALPPGAGSAVAALPRVDVVTVVRGGLVELVASRDADGAPGGATPAAGFVVPLDAIAVDPSTYPAFVPPGDASLLAGLVPGEALLSAGAARLRGLDVGATLDLGDGTTLHVAGVVDDLLVAAAEVVVAGAALPDLRPRYLLVRHSGERAALEEAVRAALPGVALRIRGPGETPWFRHGDAVLPPLVVKERFGEFSYRRAGGDEIQQDRGWATGHLETGEVPLLGRVTCHRAMVPALRGALAELEGSGLGWLVDPGGFGGCYNPRLARSLDSVSRHAWGLAVDLNVDRNPYGEPGVQDRRLVEVLERWGFTWGGQWLVPDPAHFEYVGDPPQDG